MAKQKMKSVLVWVMILIMLIPTNAYAEGWSQENSDWYYEQNGERQAGWINDGTGWYHFDENKKLHAGWYKEGETWYFLNPIHDGYYGKALTSQWAWIDGYCYLFDADGKMYANCITPDGYVVNADGRWTVDGVVQFEAGKGIITTGPMANSQTASSGTSGTRSSGGGGGGSSSGGGGGSGGGGSSSGGNNSGDGKPGEGGDPNNHVEFAEGVEVKTTEFTLDEDTQTVTVSDVAAVNGWKEGGVYILQNEYFPENDIAVKIVSIENTGKNIIIHYEEPALEEVIESLDVQGSQVEEGIFIPEEDVNMIPEENLRTRASTSGSVDLFKKYRMETEWEGIKLSCVFQAESFDYRFSVADEGKTIEEIYFVFNNSIDGTIQYSATLKKSITKKLGKVVIPLAYGFNVTGDLFITFDSNGKIEIGFKINNKAGGTYTKAEGFVPAVTLNGGITNVKLEGSMSTCIVLEPKINFLKMQVVDATVKAGIGFDGKAEIFNRDPLELCVDGKDYWILTETVDIGPKIMKLYHYEKSIYNVNNAVISQLHIEENGIVPKCTREEEDEKEEEKGDEKEENIGGNYQGFVKDSISQKPIDNAKIIVINENGNTVEQVYTDKNGFFKGKKIPSGKYKFQISASDYSSGSVIVEIINNKTTDTIVLLEPIQKKNSNVTGCVRDVQTNDPIAQARVAIIQDAEMVDVVYTNENGVYESSLLFPGSYHIQVSAQGFETKTLPLTIQANVTETLDICMQPGEETGFYGYISKHYGWDTTGNDVNDHVFVPIPGAKVELLSKDDGTVIATVYSDTSGYFEGICPAGEYDVKVSHEDYHSLNPENAPYLEGVIIEQGQMKEMDLCLSALKHPVYVGTKISGNKYIGECILSVTNINGLVLKEVMPFNGYYYFSEIDLLPGKYTLTVSVAGCSGSENVTVKDGIYDNYYGWYIDVPYDDSQNLNVISADDKQFSYPDNMPENEESETSSNAEQTASSSNAKRKQDSADTNNKKQEPTNANVDKTEYQANGAVIDERETTDRTINEDVSGILRKESESGKSYRQYENDKKEYISAII